MHPRFSLCLAASLALSTPAMAHDSARVAVDIAPVHSLVARVMAGVGEPALILPPGASPHGHSMRPSEAAALEQADLVIWVGHDLTPWLEKPIETLAGDAQVLELIALDGVVTHDFREDAVFGGHDDDDHGHDHGHAKKDDHSHDHDQAKKDDHAHGHGHSHDHDHDHAKKEEHAHDHGHSHAKADDHAHDHGHDHAHEGTDPHAWLDPENAKLWMNAIADRLATLDPDHATEYRANAAAGIAEIDTLQAAISARFAETPPQGFVVFHDAYQYFERRFGVETLGAITLSDATEPGAARIAELQEAAAERGVTCALAEPQFNPGLIAALFDGTEVKTGVIDPLGADLTPGPGLYPALLTAMADTLAACR